MLHKNWKVLFVSNRYFVLRSAPQKSNKPGMARVGAPLKEKKCNPFSYAKNMLSRKNHEAKKKLEKGPETVKK